MLECVKTPALCLSGTKWNWARHQRTELNTPPEKLHPLSFQLRSFSSSLCDWAAILGPPCSPCLSFWIRLRPTASHCVLELSAPEGPFEGSSFGPPQIFILRAHLWVGSHLFINISHFCDQSPPPWASVWLIALAHFQRIVGPVCPLLYSKLSMYRYFLQKKYSKDETRILAFCVILFSNQSWSEGAGLWLHE